MLLHGDAFPIVHYSSSNQLGRSYIGSHGPHTIIWDSPNAAWYVRVTSVPIRWGCTFPRERENGQLKNLTQTCAKKTNTCFKLKTSIHVFLQSVTFRDRFTRTIERN
jgi:hypothetical protein